MLSLNVCNYITLATGNLLRKKKKKKNVIMLLCQLQCSNYIPFGAGKTSHLDRLCLENSLKESRANVGRLFVCLL